MLNRFNKAGGHMAHSIKIIGLDGVSNIGLMGPVDLFAICNRIATRISGQEAQLFDVQLVSADGGPIISASGHTINMDSTLASINATDIVIVPALMLASQSELQAAIDNQQPFIQWLRDNAQTPALYATYCSGAFLLAEAGLAQHNAMTTAWFLTQHFKERYPAIELQENCMLTEGNGIICGGATTAYQDVVLRIVENCAGKHFARLLA
jgi:transcriptional regulator GlxA family with amidase domain